MADAPPSKRPRVDCQARAPGHLATELCSREPCCHTLPDSHGGLCWPPRAAGPHASAMSPTMPLSSACAGRTTAGRQRWQPSPSRAAPDARCGAVSPSVRPIPPRCVSPHGRAPATDPARAASRASAAPGEPAPRDTLARLESVERVFCSQTLVVASPAAPAGVCACALPAVAEGTVARCTLSAPQQTRRSPVRRARWRARGALVVGARAAAAQLGHHGCCSGALPQNRRACTKPNATAGGRLPRAHSAPQAAPALLKSPSSAQTMASGSRTASPTCAARPRRRRPAAPRHVGRPAAGSGACRAGVGGGGMGPRRPRTRRCAWPGAALMWQQGAARHDLACVRACSCA